MYSATQEADWFRCDRYGLTDRVAVVAVGGEVDIDTAPALQTILLAAFTARVSDVIVDLHDVTLMDSTGLSALVAAWQLATERGGRVRLVGTSRSVRKILSITALDQIFPVYDSVTAAGDDCGEGLLTGGREGSPLARIQAIGDRATVPAV